jgi:proline dehydrogenase
MPALGSALIALSQNRVLRRFFERSLPGRKISSRFVAGAEPGDALGIAEILNHQGIAVALDSLGETVTTEIEAHKAANVYHQLLDSIAARKLNANINVKLTQLGVGVSSGLAMRVVENLAEHAGRTGNFVRIEMENSTWTQTTLDLVRRVHARPGLRNAIGISIQAYLYRSQADIEQLLAEGISVRLCSGAYREPAQVAFPRKADVDANYIRLCGMLLDSQNAHALSTHNGALIAAVKSMVRERGVEQSRFEFQMQYGVRRGLQRKLVRQGYKVRVRVPFGTEWYPYFVKLLADRPGNTMLIARNFLLE